jgi:hypothetical protein
VFRRIVYWTEFPDVDGAVCDESRGSWWQHQPLELHHKSGVRTSNSIDQHQLWNTTMLNPDPTHFEYRAVNGSTGIGSLPSSYAHSLPKGGLNLAMYVAQQARQSLRGIAGRGAARRKQSGMTRRCPVHHILKYNCRWNRVGDL